MARLRRLGQIILILTGFFSAPSTSQGAEKIMVFAAASTRDILTEAITENGNVKITGVYAASSALARQILDGAPASLFLSANLRWIQLVRDAGLVAISVPIARNRLVVVSRQPEPLDGIDQIVHMLGDGRLAIADTRAVPAGTYARQALESLGVWETVKRQIAVTAHVRAALFLVERGETPLGIVYRSDAAAISDVHEAWTIPASSHDPIVYHLAMMSQAKSDLATRNFFDFLRSSAGQRLFRRYSFETD